MSIFKLLEEKGEVEVTIQMQDGGFITSIAQNTYYDDKGIPNKVDYTISGYGGIFEKRDENSIKLNKQNLRYFLVSRC